MIREPMSGTMITSVYRTCSCKHGEATTIPGVHSDKESILEIHKMVATSKGIPR